MWQEHAAQHHRRSRARFDRRRGPRRSRDPAARHGSHGGVPELLPHAVDDRVRQHPSRGAGGAPGLASDEHRSVRAALRRHGRTRRRGAEAPGGAVGRHAAEGGSRAGVVDGAEGAGPRRALRADRRPHAWSHPGRARSDVDGQPQHGVHGHARRRRGDLAVGSNRANDARSGGASGRAGGRGAPATAQPRRPHRRPRIPAAAHPHPSFPRRGGGVGPGRGARWCPRERDSYDASRGHHRAPRPSGVAGIGIVDTTAQSSARKQEDNMERTVALEKIRSARVARGISYEDLGKAIGTKDPTYIAAALHGQHRLNAEEAKRLAAAVGIDAETAMVTTAMPLRTDFPLTTDPFKYRLMELVGVYGDALRERCNELFGDGILSAIDCVVKLEKTGERGVLTIDAKFLHYKEY